MILKRLLATALGALGLGALAAGPAFGQAPGSSNIPAPDIFDDQITCTQLLPTPANVISTMTYNLPSSVPMGSMATPLDDIIGMGENQLLAGDTVFDAVTDAAEKLAGLGYVIPPGNMNCGAGTTGPTLGTVNMDGNGDGDFLDAGDTLAWGSIPKDVADGYTTLLGLYEDVYGNPGATTGGTMRELAAAQKLLDETDASLTALVDARTRARDAAQEAHNKAVAKFNAASGGPIYTAGVAEWMAKMAVTQGIDDYNEQVMKTNDARTALNAMQYSEWNVGTEAEGFAVTQGDSKYVPLANSDLVDGTVVTFDGMGGGTVNFGMALTDYTGGTESTPVAGTAGVPAMGTTAAVSSMSADSNFTTLGALIVPMTAGDHDSDATTVDTLAPTVTATNAAGTNDIATIRTRVENTRIAAAVLKKAAEDNTNPRFQDLYDVAYARAMAEQNYYDALWSQVLADTEDNRTAQQRLRYLDNGTGTGEANNGINDLSEQTATNINTAYEADAITIASRNAAYSTESGKRMNEEASLRQLVANREAATSDVVSHFTNARSFYQQLVDRRTALLAAADGDDATEAAQKSLNAARMAQTTINGLFPDDEGNPTVGLVSELLKTGGDDGQALVDAVSDTYDATQANEGRLDALLTTDADGTESGRIVDIENMLGEGGNVEQLQSDLGALAGDGRTDETVKGNADEITGLDGRVADNEEDLDAVWMDTYGSPRGVDMQHDGLADCDATTGSLPIARCAKAIALHNEADIEDVNDKLMDKKEYIGNLGAAIGVDPVTGEGTGEDGMSKIDMNAKAIADETQARKDADTALGGRIDKEVADRMSADEALGGRIDKEVADRMSADEALGGRIDKEVADRMSADEALGGRIDKEVADRMSADEALGGRIDKEVADRMSADEALGMRIDKEEMDRMDADLALGGLIMDEEKARMDADTMLGGRISAEEMARMDADTGLGGRISDNADDIAANMNLIGQNRTAISDNRNMIGELSDDLDVVRAGVAASMALAGMPAINGRGIAIGVGSYDGESAFAVGFQIQGEQASFKVGVTSSGGETGASAGVGFNF